MNRRPWLYRTAGLALSLSLAPLALADVPAALDRVPSDTPVVITMKNMGQFYSSVKSLAQTLKLPEEAMGGLARGGDMLKTQGLNPDGPAAMAVLSVDEKETEPVVMVVPVKDYAAFAKALGGSGSGVDSVKINDENAFVKDLGGGFAAVSPSKANVEKFAGKEGSSKAFETLMGATGKAVAESSDAFMVANMEKVGPKLKEGLEQAKENMAMMAAMSGGQNQSFVDAMGAAMDGFVRDGQAGIIGLRINDGGVKMDFAAQFKEGSEYAGYFKSKGKASALIGALPNLKEGYLLAGAIDTSGPGIRQMFKNMMDRLRKDPEASKMMSGLNPLEQVEKTDGVAFCWGTSPALMGGVFLNTSSFIKTSDPAGYLKTLKEGLGNLNGKTVQGMGYQTSFESGGGKVGDKPVDVWTMKMTPDPNNPQAQQIAQAQMMMFGPTGLAGYASATDSGVVLTYAKNSDLMTAALAAAKGSNGLNGDTGVKSVSSSLPADRTLELYIGVKSILETVQGFMGMMGGGGGNMPVPAELPPVGIGGTGENGGARASLFVPMDVIKTIKAFADQAKGGAEDEMDAPKKKDKTGQPKF
jgi:hypothetical protein